MFELAYANEFAHQCYANLVSMATKCSCLPFARLLPTLKMINGINCHGNDVTFLRPSVSVQ